MRKKKQIKMTKVQVWKLGWDGMEKRTITVQDFPRDILKVDDWFAPSVGELCFDSSGKINKVMEIKYRPADLIFKGGDMVRLSYDKTWYSISMVERIEVKKGKEFIFRGKKYYHQKPKAKD